MKDGWVKLDDLMGSAEVCELLHIEHTSTLHTIRRRARDRGTPFPEPVKELSGASIWDRPEVVAWGIGQGYLNTDGTFKGRLRAGRPRKATSGQD